MFISFSHVFIFAGISSQPTKTTTSSVRWMTQTRAMLLSVKGNLTLLIAIGQTLLDDCLPVSDYLLSEYMGTDQLGIHWNM